MIACSFEPEAGGLDGPRSVMVLTGRSFDALLLPIHVHSVYSLHCVGYGGATPTPSIKVAPRNTPLHHSSFGRPIPSLTLSKRNSLPLAMGSLDAQVAHLLPFKQLGLGYHALVLLAVAFVTSKVVTYYNRLKVRRFASLSEGISNVLVE